MGWEPLLKGPRSARIAQLMAGVTATGGAAEWDERLLLWPRANLLQSYRWGAVQGRAGWSTERLLVESPSGALPVTALVGRVGVAGLTRLYVPRGPVCAPDDLDAFVSAMEALQDLGRRRRALVLEVEVPWEAGEVPSDHPLRAFRPGHPRQPLATVVVDLRPKGEELISSFHAKTRYNVRLAERRGVTVRPGTLAELSSCIRATEARQRIRLPSDGHLRAVCEELGQDAWVLVAEVEGEVAAGVLLARWGEQLVYLYGGATNRQRQAMPNYLLHWRAMMMAHEEGCWNYDLWGIPDNDSARHPWHGLAQFKRGFGGREVTYAGCWLLELRPLGGRMTTAADAVREQLRRRR